MTVVQKLPLKDFGRSSFCECLTEICHFLCQCCQSRFRSFVERWRQFKLFFFTSHKKDKGLHCFVACSKKWKKKTRPTSVESQLSPEESFNFSPRFPSNVPGSGKSSTISLCTGRAVPSGSGQERVTAKCAVYEENQGWKKKTHTKQFGK